MAHASQHTLTIPARGKGRCRALTRWPRDVARKEDRRLRDSLPPGQGSRIWGSPTPSPLRGATSPPFGGRGKVPGTASARPSSPPSFGGEVVGNADRSGVVLPTRLRHHKREDAVAFLLAGIETSPVSRDRRLRNALSLWSGSGWGCSRLAETSSGRLAGCCVGRHAVILQIARGRKRSTRNFAAISASCRLRAASASRGRGPGDGTPFSPDELAARMWQYHAGSIGGPRS